MENRLNHPFSTAGAALLAIVVVVVTFLTARVAEGADTAHMTALKSRLLSSILPPTPDDLENLHADALRFASSLSAAGAWPDIDYADQAPSAWKTGQHLNRMLVMAKACYIARRQTDPDPNLTASTRLALTYW